MYLEREGRRIAYDVVGTGPTALIFIPALGATGRMWDDQVEEFQNSYTTITCTPAGHDREAVYAAQPTLSHYAADVAALLHHVAAIPAHIVGLSMGGMIAQELAIHFPPLVASLTLASTASEYPDDVRSQMMARAAGVERDGMADVIESRLAAWFTPAFRQSAPERVEPIREQLRGADPAAYAQAARAVAGVTTTGRLPRIESPVLLIEADGDRSMPPGSADRIAEQLVRVERRRIADAAHLCNVEQPEQFTGHLMRFLSSVAST